MLKLSGKSLNGAQGLAEREQQGYKLRFTGMNWEMPESC